MNYDLHQAISYLDRQIEDPRHGLPEEVFRFVSRVTPLVNVDLLIKDERNRTLLAWRDDEYAGRGWHLPGGIVRFKERFEERVRKVAETEIGVVLEFNPDPIAVNQVICDHDIRGHFISILYRCFLPSTFVPENKGLKETSPGYLKWHESCPDNLVKVHEMYRKYI